MTKIVVIRQFLYQNLGIVQPPPKGFFKQPTDGSKYSQLTGQKFLKYKYMLVYHLFSIFVAFAENK